MMYYNECKFITEFRGERANDYATHFDYVKDGAWEKDYFLNWLTSYSEDEYPSLDEIGDCCKTVAYYIGHWLDGVEAGLVDPEAGMKN